MKAKLVESLIVHIADTYRDYRDFQKSSRLNGTMTRSRLI